MSALAFPGDDVLTPLLTTALAEDVGPGDRTTERLVPPDLKGHARVVAKAPAVVAGLRALSRTCELVGPGTCRVETRVSEGARVGAGETLATIEGSYRTILTAERVAMNVLCHLSGIATMTARFVDAVEGTGAVIVDTRKTHPGLRALEKHAVRAGGGENHRMGLYDAILVKENHVAAAGSVEAAVRAALSPTPGVPVMIEVRSSKEAITAVRAGAPALLLDNFTPEAVRETVATISSKTRGVVIEVSGNVTLENVRAYAAAGAHRISIGALTHSSPAADVSLLAEPAA